MNFWWFWWYEIMIHSIYMEIPFILELWFTEGVWLRLFCLSKAILIFVINLFDIKINIFKTQELQFWLLFNQQGFRSICTCESLTQLVVSSLIFECEEQRDVFSRGFHFKFDSFQCFTFKSLNWDPWRVLARSLNLQSFSQQLVHMWVFSELPVIKDHFSMCLNN